MKPSKNFFAIAAIVALLAFTYPANAASLTMNGGSITLDGTQNYDSISLTNGAIIYVTPYNGAGTTGTLILNVAGDVNVDATSSINGDLRGGTGGNGGAVSGYPGYGGTGTGGGGTGSTYSNSGGGGGGGAGYVTTGAAGGFGGGGPSDINNGVPGGSGGSVFGTSNGQDISMGAGAGGGGGSTYGDCGPNTGGNGQAGGAVVTINAGGNINLHGTITMDGGNGGGGGSDNCDGNGGGGGSGASGGGIKLSGTNIDVSNSVITATGGSGGGGGGGAHRSGTSGGSGSNGRYKAFYKVSYTATGASITAGSTYSENVNSAPTFTSATEIPNPVDPGATAKITTGASDPDGDTLKLYVCKSNDGTSSGCGAGGSWCSNTTATTNPMCAFTAPATAGAYNYYAYLFDSYNAAASNNPLSGTFTAAKSNGAACTASSECLSNNCAVDYDGTGKWCEPATSCAHNGVEYVNGAYAPDCYDTNTQRVCSSGSWTTNGCGLFKKCSGGTCADSDDDNDGVLDKNDKCLNTPGTCNVGNGKINSANGCPFAPFSYTIKNDLSESCPSASIPVDPDNAGCLSATDAARTIALKIGTYTANPSCDTLAGTTGWHDASDGRNYCEFKIDGTVPVGTYNLHAVYSINGVNYDQTFKSGFNVASTCSTSSGCSHGGHMTAAPTASLSLSPACILSGGKYICKTGTTASITGISSVVPQCSDGSTTGAVTPGVIAWLYSGNVYKTHLSNNFGGCATPAVPVPMKYRADLLLETAGLLWPCDIGWTTGASSTSINNLYNFASVADAGTYTLYLDYINAFCDSPDYICPTNSGLCAFGSMSGDYRGFENFAQYNIVIVNPDMSFTSAPNNPYVVAPDMQDETVTLSWVIKNTGVGDLDVTVSPSCTGITCTLVQPTSKTTIPQGGSITATMTVPLACSTTDYTKNVGISVEYQDSYGLYSKATKANITLFTVTVPKPDLKVIGSASNSINVDGKTMQVVSVEVENNGTLGNTAFNSADVSASRYLCPNPANCPATLPGKPTLSSGERTRINMTFDPECYTSIFLNISYDDAYGLACIKRPSMLYEVTSLKKADSCQCLETTECLTQCNNNVCGQIKPPVIEITPTIIDTSGGEDTPPSATGVTASTVTVAFGTKSNFLLTLSNPNPITREIPMHLDSTSEAKNWVWFAGHRTDSKRRDMTVTIKPFENSTINLEILGARPGVYKLYLGPDADYKNKYGEIIITVVQRNSGFVSTTPDMGWATFFLTLAAGIAASLRRKAL